MKRLGFVFTSQLFSLIASSESYCSKFHAASLESSQGGNRCPWRYRVEHEFQPNELTEGPSRLPQVLRDLEAYPSLSMAKKACLHEKVLLLRPHRCRVRAELVETDRIAWCFRETFENTTKPIIGKPSSVVKHGDVILIQTREDDEFYPVSVTKYVLPPPLGVSLANVIFQDDKLAVVNKPENITTIEASGSRQDMQSILPFILRPSSTDPRRLPRPVHRLDRRTSGLLLVAKTKATMQQLSSYFSGRQIQKTYIAIVYGDTANIPRGWQRIDYPIEGKTAITDYRILSSSPFHNSMVSIVQARPRTGRNHQIRRHLSYCLGLPIVGDAKYDKGASFLRTNGMFLCATELEFPYDMVEESVECRNGGSYELRDQAGVDTIRITIPMPEKFRQFMRKTNMQKLQAETRRATPSSYRT